MDPLTQGLLGATAAQTFAKKENIRLAALCGTIGGMTPDLDTLIRSAEDPLLFIEFHRHFTHALAFAPIGSLVIAIVIWLLCRLIKKEYNFTPLYLFTLLGFATHGLLDACTSYGTLLYWPFSYERISWNIISIIDPIFTSLLLIFCISSLIIRSKITAIISLTTSLLYLGLGIAQHKGVKEYISGIAKSRGHKIERLLLNPTIGNIVLWRSVYLYDGTYYIDAVHHPYLTSTKTKLLASNKTPFLDIEKQFPELKEGSKQKEDAKRFAYFSQGYVYLHPKYPNTIADLRYGSLPHDLYSLWGIKITPEQNDQHVTLKNLRNFEKDHYQLFWSMLKGKSPSEVKEEH